MEVVNEQITKEATVTVNVVGGKIQVAANLDTSGADAKLEISVDVDYFLDVLAAKIPGQVDDAVIAIFKAALKAI